ncbi:MAG TPA: CUAEP/CCAEP-tail radical SAM protein [Candidatus Limnocylindrales bacterium]|nr:CUAEP/CCAEP-tail radical SAM protein [Candidatus Limnocylindrales bacterium]
MNVVLISTYELGRQPFGLASPAAWLRECGMAVTCADVSREPLPDEAVRLADLVAFYVPMHTATRLAVALLPAIREMNPRAHLCFYGLYAPVNEVYLRRLGVGTILGGEFEEGLTNLAASLDPADGKVRFSGGGSFSSHVTGTQSGGALAPEAKPASISLARQHFRVPDRAGLPPLEKYARLITPKGESRTVGYTEASRGCKHLCRHCPIVPVYNGTFRIVDRDVVLEDIRRQVASGAQHITFGDPDFFNGPGHAIPLVEALHREFPRLTYDVTIKVEHLLQHRDALPKLRDTGCLFVTSAVESVDDAILDRLAKNHTRADFLRVVDLFHEVGLTLAPTFVAFTPWTTLAGFYDLLEVIRERGLIENVAPIQFAIRLLIPAGSRLLDLPEVRSLVGPFDDAALVHPWRHDDPRVDALCERLQEVVHSGEKMNRPRARIFELIEQAACQAVGRAEQPPRPTLPVLASRATIPYLNEPWYC